MRKIFVCSILVVFVCIQQISSQEEEGVEDDLLYGLIVNYLQALAEKDILGEAHDGKEADANIITADMNFMILPQGIIISYPVIPEAKDLIDAIGDQTYTNIFGTMVWIVYFDPEKKVMVFEDTGK
ncbi:MAG: hypothetical protein LBT00_02370 [Spirochaetaceae bacterium]|jgi:hypothetical protein|nr:hypothetical protein [Spirochaetaceae bacterium]